MKTPGVVRLIGGQWKRSVLPVANLPGLRPTPNRVRETLFNWLAHYAENDLSHWQCLDAFAGTGALGFEAASRGVRQVTLVEQNPVALQHLQTLQTKLKAQQVRVERGDGLMALQRCAAGSMDVIFLDPPFNYPAVESLIAAAAAALKPNGLIYLEAPKPYSEHLLEGLQLTIYRHLQAGMVHAHLLRKTKTV